jgi:hypothetical protein
MGRRKRIKWDYGDVFAVPLVDGTFGLVQTIDHWLPHWIYTAITDGRIDSLPAADATAQPGKLISLLAVDDDPFDFGGFSRMGHTSPMARKSDFSNESFAERGYVGAESYTGSVVAGLLSAWHKLAPWNICKDEMFFDKLLIAGLKRPTNVLLKIGS